MRRTIDIAALMVDKELSQRDMAEILGVSQSYVSEIKNKRKPLSRNHEELLIQQFGQDVCDMYRVAKTNTASDNDMSEHDELIKLRTLIELHQKELADKDAYYKAIIDGKDKELEILNAHIAELKKVNDYLMAEK